MKAPPSPSARSAFALVVVLIFLVIVTGIAVAFFSSVTTNYTTTNQSSSGAASKELADSVVHVVMGQVKTATTGSGLAWASQPGMIRTYDALGSSGTNYKLYSSGTMTTSGPLTLAQVSDYDPAWSGKTAAWTDLNSPVTDTSGTADFPIIDGNNMMPLTEDAAGNSVPQYFGYAGGTNGLPAVAGFGVTPNSVSSLSPVTFNPSVAVSGTNTPVPMPVQWLYQLSDGTLIAPDTSSTTTATFANAAIKPSTGNPIVGRVAFWTDDETCKVNINTAGEGTYWDTPRFYPTTNDPNALSNSATLMQPSNLEMQYAINQPAIGEFQRYPGHPAQVALSPIFPKLLALATNPAALAQTMAGITPRLASGGSVAGTARATGPIDLSGTSVGRPALYASVDELMFGTPATSGTRPLTADSSGNSLFSKSDIAQARFFITANSRGPEVNLFGLPRISTWPINTDLLKNPANSPYTTAYDRLTAFCSTTGTALYHFQRQKFNDTTFDATIPRNIQLYEYLQNLTSNPIPGFGGTFSAKYKADRDQILTEIFDYIRCTDDFDATLSPVGALPPTQSGSSTTYQFAQYQNYNDGSSSFGQITPIHITPAQIPTVSGTTMGFGRFPTVSEVGVAFICCADASNPASTTACTWPEAAKLASNITTPGKLAATTGANSTNPAWLNQVNNFMTVNGVNYFPSWSNPAQNPAYKGVQLTATNQKLYQMALLLKTFCPEQGLFPIKGDYIIKITGLDTNVQITGATPANPFPKPPYATYYCNKVGADQYAIDGNSGVPGTWGPAFQSGSHQDPLGYIQGEYYMGYPIYPFISQPFILTSASNFAFAQPVSLTIQIYQGLYSADTNQSNLGSNYASPTGTTVASVVNNPANLVQTINISLPNNPFPVPTLAVTANSGDSGGWNYSANWVPWGAGVMYNYGQSNNTNVFRNWQAWFIPARVDWYGQLNLSYSAEPYYNQSWSNPWTWSDVVRSVSIYHGDARLVAASPVVSSTVFLPHPLYNQPAKPVADYFRLWAFDNSAADPNPAEVSGSQGKLVNINYSTGFKPRAPDVPTVPLCANPSGKALSDPTLSNPFCGPAYTMDWDNSIVGETEDGAYINKADDGDFEAFNQSGWGLPYFNYIVSTSTNSLTNASTFLTPNRLMPSPGIFGSLPTGVIRGLPWETLLFRPGLQANGQLHPNAGAPAYGPTGGPPYTTPPDDLIMDLFWTPVVEPYAISDPFSTAGKINMNYQIAPFTYIDRNTALACLMKSEKLIAVPTTGTNGTNYKDFTYSAPHNVYRLSLDTTENGSLYQFKLRLWGPNPSNPSSSTADLFRSPAEICDVFLKPVADALGNLQSWSTSSYNAYAQSAVNFWNNNLLTGDNMREKPYANLYGRLTTKSNTYTVHFRVQSLQKVRSTNPAQWVDGTDKVTSEYRGSTVIERYLDTSDPTIPDFAGPNPPPGNLESHYKFRVVSTKKFSP